MKKILALRGFVVLGIALMVVFCLPIACKRDKELSISKSDRLSNKVASIKNWWENRKINKPTNSTEILSRIPDSANIQNYWRSQFQNGIPKWTNARMFNIGEETVYEVPFQFPDNLVLMNDKPDASPQLYITGKAGSNEVMKPSQTYLIVKERAGIATVAEIMCVVLNNSYIQMLDSLGTTYPNIRITNLYPAPKNLGDFCGSVKFYDLDGVQLLEEGYDNGTIYDYIEYGRCNFPITPHPNLSTARMYSVCTWTYVYQQNCAPDAGCTDWELIGIIFNGCETVVVPDSPPVILPPGGGNGGSGGSYPLPPQIQNNPLRPGARLCGNYNWKTVGDAVYVQIRNLGASFLPNNPGGGVPQTFTLGLTCIHFPKWYVTQMGWDVTEFINRAYNMAAERMQREMNSGALPTPPSVAIYQPKFEEYMEFYLKNHPNGSYHHYATILFRNGCDGPIPISEPKWCYPVP